MAVHLQTGQKPSDLETSWRKVRVQRPSLEARVGPLRHIHWQPPPSTPCLLIMHLLITTNWYLLQSGCMPPL